jgi:hypothetical protein
MRTDELIDTLALSVMPVGRSSIGTRLAKGVAGGAVASLAILFFVLGRRPDLELAVLGFSFWMKLAYTASFAAAALYLTARQARPGEGSSDRPLVLAVPVLSLSLFAAIELGRAPTGEWLSMWLGQSWKICSSIVLLLSLPIFLGLLWSFRKFAPTRLRAAGAAAGLAAGSCAATVYCIHCPEVSAAFVLTWYSLGIGLAALGGALAGPRLLRW